MAVDFGYHYPEVFNENVFTVAGPGCKRGVNRLFKNRGEYSYEECIQYLVDNQKAGFQTHCGVDVEEYFKDEECARIKIRGEETK
eukprot:UN24029